MAWLMRDGEVLAAVEVAETTRARRRGLTHRDRIDGALVLRPCRNVHTVGMKFPIDVAFCDRYGFVLHRSTLVPRRVSRLVWRSYFAIEARAGSFERWKLEPGDVIEVRG